MNQKENACLEQQLEMEKITFCSFVRVQQQQLFSHVQRLFLVTVKVKHKATSYF